jgi:UDP-glucose 4-epimerase
MQIDGGRFVITGGASLIGSHTAEALLAEGAAHVVLLDNYALGSPESIADLIPDPRVKLVRGDVLRINELYDTFEGADGVFAVAGFLTLPMAQDPLLGLAVNVQGHANVLEACRYRGARRVVFASSTAVYGEPSRGPMTEETSFDWARFQPAAAMYAASKIVGENLGRHYAGKYGIGTVSLRYATVYGERQHYRGINALYIVENYDRIRRGERPQIPGDGREVHDYIHVKDVARANVMAMASTVSGESLNVVTGIATTLDQLIATLLRVMGSNLQPEYRPVPEMTRVSVGTELAFGRDKIQSVLGWEPRIDLEQGIRRLVEWREREEAKRTSA